MQINLEVLPTHINSYVDAELWVYWNDKEVDYNQQPFEDVDELFKAMTGLQATLPQKWTEDQLVKRMETAFVKNMVVMNTPKVIKIRHATMNAAIANPLLLFQDGYWEDRELGIIKETILWMVAQEILGYPWAKYWKDKLTKEINEIQDKIERTDKAKLHAAKKRKEAGSKAHAVTPDKRKGQMAAPTVTEDPRVHDVDNETNNNMDIATNQPAPAARTYALALRGNAKSPKKMTTFGDAGPHIATNAPPTTPHKSNPVQLSKADKLQNLRQMNMKGLWNTNNVFYKVSIPYKPEDNQDSKDLVRQLMTKLFEEFLHLDR
jgi:hypothetical protein